MARIRPGKLQGNMYAFANKNARQNIKSKNLSSLNQSIAEKLEEKASSPSKFIGRGANASIMALDGQAGSPVHINNGINRSSTKKHSTYSQSESLKGDSQFPYGSEPSTKSIILKSNAVPMAFDNDPLDRENEDILN